MDPGVARKPCKERGERECVRSNEVSFSLKHRLQMCHILGLQSLLGSLLSCSVNHLDVGVCRYRLLPEKGLAVLECPHSWFLSSCSLEQKEET